jgi:drug/metabolite transporter (DMT)-like permease
VPVHGEVIAAVAVLAAPCTALAFLLFFALIAEAGPVRATVITYVNPAIALAVGILFLSERLTLGKVVGFVLILAGSVLSTRRPAPERDERVRETTEAVAAEVAAP